MTIEPPYTEAVNFRVVLEFDPVANAWSAVCPELPGCASTGGTGAEARQNIEEAIRFYLVPTRNSRTRTQARTRLKSAVRHGLVRVGEKNWTRDDLHGRR